MYLKKRNGLNELKYYHGEYSDKFTEQSELASKMVYPFMESTNVRVVHNTTGFSAGINAEYFGVSVNADTDIIIRKHPTCLGPECMAFDMETLTCTRCSK